MDKPTILETRGLNKHFGGVIAAENVNFQVGEGELRCIIGPNGAGKSTLFSMLCGIQRPDSGQIFISGRDVTRMLSFKRVDLGIGLTFQNNRAFHELSVRDNLAITRPKNREGRGDLGRQRYHYALEAFGLDPDDPSPARELSHDQLQWLEIAMVLGGYPDLILLDEPTAGMAPEETGRTSDVLKHLNSTGLTIILVEHDMEFVRQLAQTVTVLHQGQIFAEGTIDSIIADEDVKRIYLGKG